jgi:predicted  nucleic acid-binding Zn-ribbon protein
MWEIATGTRLAHGAGMLRNVVLSVATLVLGLTGLSATAAASSSAAQCDAMLGDVETARETLDQLERSLAEVDAERAELVEQIAGLAHQLVAAQAKGHATLALRAEQDALQLEVSLIDDVRPQILAQLDALRSSVDASERSYIACIETVIAS